jgi:hypothetical protein
MITDKERNEFVMNDRMNKLPDTVVDITSPGINAMLGRYFIGQSGELYFGNGSTAWSGIVNPLHSNVSLFFDIFTITNYSDVNYTAEIWLNAKAPIGARTSSTVTPSNQAAWPPPKPIAVMKYTDDMKNLLIGGINIFDRIVTPNSTLVSDSHKGSIIIGPGGSFSVLLKSTGQSKITGTVVLTWWEESFHSYDPLI